MRIDTVEVKDVLTRTSGYLRTVTSHSLQPYRGCPLGLSLCGAGCYVQHNRYLTGGRTWGRFLDARVNAADSYRRGFARERSWARRSRGGFSVFLSSSTEPFPPQERRLGITRSVLEAMVEAPPDALVLQTHSHRAIESLDLVKEVARRCDLRAHVSIETDREEVPGLPRHASSVAARFEAAARLRAAGIFTVITVSPLLPIESPDAFFRRIARSADAVVIDHFIEGDGTPDGRRTRRTAMPQAMAALDPASVEIAYRERMVEVARRHLPGRVGVGIDGFAGRYA